MRLPYFEYLEAQTVAGLLDMLAEHRGKARLLAGGTDLLPRMRRGLLRPEYVLGLKKLVDLKGIRMEASGLRIGAMTTLAELVASPVVKKQYTALYEAALSVAAPPIQHVATLAGNLCQNSRCLFYNQSDVWRKEQRACLKAGGQRCLAVPGAKICFSVYQGDLGPGIMALGGTVRMEKRGSSRTVPVERLFTGKGEQPIDAADDELVTELVLPAPQKGGGSSYRKMRIRSAIDYPLVSAAASVLIDEGERIASVRVVLGGVGPAPLLLTGAPEALVGRPLRSIDLDEVAGGITKGTRMVDNLPVPASYRKRVAPVFVKRALQAALESASKREGA